MKSEEAEKVVCIIKSSVKLKSINSNLRFDFLSYSVVQVPLNPLQLFDPKHIPAYCRGQNLETDAKYIDGGMTTLLRF